jgi:hypothetical protein
LGFELGGFTGDRRDPDQMSAAGTLDLPARKLLVALQMLVTMRTRKLEFAHKTVGRCIINW